MSPDVVVDVGNSRIKWGLCRQSQVQEFIALPLDNDVLWADQFSQWRLSAQTQWAVCGVNPSGLERLLRWLDGRSGRVTALSSYRQLPITVSVEAPEKVGIDRLLNAVAASQRARSGVSSFIVDAGSAVTVDWLDAAGAFRGGAIFPGLRLMARALHDFTALLPVVDFTKSEANSMPGTNTAAAIGAGILGAAAGGVRELLRQLAYQAPDSDHQVFLTGGDAGHFEAVMVSGFIAWPEMTLEGIRRSAEKLP
jgi:type III pantothenate kinase